jgi:hypothetical protein
MSNFLCITFGPSNDVARNGWFNRKQRFDDVNDAKQCGRRQLSQPGTFGYVVIEEGEDWWEVVDELGAPAHAVSISCNRLGTFKVEPASVLQIVA